jgi:hypothetical protein
MMTRLPEDTATASNSSSAAVTNPYRGLMSHRVDSDNVRSIVEFFHQSSSTEDQAAASSSSRLVYFDVWTAQQNAGRTRLDPITWARAPAWNVNRIGHIPGVLPPLLGHPGTHTADKFCFSFASTGVCSRGPDCLFPHLEQREADEVKRSFGGDEAGGNKSAPLSPLARELIALKKKFDAQWAQLTKGSPAAPGNKNKEPKQPKQQKKKPRKSKRGKQAAGNAENPEPGDSIAKESTDAELSATDAKRQKIDVQEASPAVEQTDA